MGLLPSLYMPTREVPAVGVVQATGSAMAEENAARPHERTRYNEVLHPRSRSRLAAAPQTVVCGTATRARRAPYRRGLECAISLCRQLRGCSPAWTGRCGLDQ